MANSKEVYLARKNRVNSSVGQLNFGVACVAVAMEQALLHFEEHSHDAILVCELYTKLADKPQFRLQAKQVKDIAWHVFGIKIRKSRAGEVMARVDKRQYETISSKDTREMMLFNLAMGELPSIKFGPDKEVIL